MNARELAEWLRDYASNSYCSEFEQAAAMLLQQQSEIEIQKQLKQEMHEFHNAAMREAFELLGIEHNEYRFKWVALAISNLRAENEALHRGHGATKTLYYNKGHEAGRNLAIPAQVERMSK